MAAACTHSPPDIVQVALSRNRSAADHPTFNRKSDGPATFFSLPLTHIRIRGHDTYSPGLQQLYLTGVVWSGFSPLARIARSDAPISAPDRQ
jgi:hypothetical protein